LINSSRNPSKKGKNVGFDKEVNEKERQREVARRKALRAEKKTLQATSSTATGEQK